MTPDYQVKINGRDITTDLRKRLVSMTITDEDGYKSDKVDITIDDTGNKVEAPEEDALVEVAVGYKETGLVWLGKYYIDTVKFSGKPDKMKVSARAAKLSESLKEHKTRSWDKKFLKEIVNAIALEHSLTPAIDDELGRLYFDHIDQTEESDLHFLTRISADYNAIAKPVENHLVFTRRATGKNVSGKDMPVLNIRYNEVTSYDADLAKRAKYGAVRTSYHHKESGRTLYYYAGKGKPVYTMRYNYKDREQAVKAAQRKLDEFMEDRGKLTLNLPGRTGIMTESIINLIGFRPEIAGRWIVKKITYKISNSGFKITIGAGE